MNISRVATFSLALAVAVFALGYMNPSVANKTGLKHNHGDGGSDDSDKNLQATFNLTIDSPSSGRQFIFGDAAYVDSNKDHVLIFTGQSDGFRFDTNSQNTSKESRYMKGRLVMMTVTGSSGDIMDYEIDFRFNQTDGLDLGSLDTQDASGTVAATLRYYGGQPVVGFDATNYGKLGFGALNAPAPTGAAANCVTDVGPILVTRTGIDPAEWTLESPASKRACRFELDANGDRCISEGVHCGFDDIAFQFKFIITQQP